MLEKSSFFEKNKFIKLSIFSHLQDPKGVLCKYCQ